jgi:hypothetical protein
LDKVVHVGDVQCKTILVYGEKDAIVDLADVRFLASQIPHSEVRIIKDVGHFLHLEKKELLDVYEDILSSLDVIPDKRRYCLPPAFVRIANRRVTSAGRGQRQKSLTVLR